jgi:hypothetical protein
MMRAAKAMLGQSVIDGAREPRITEKQKLNAAPHLMLAQKQGGRRRRSRYRRWGSHIDVSKPSP